MKTKEPFKIFATDILTIDNTVNLAESERLQEVAARLGASKGSKTRKQLSNDEFSELVGAVAGCNVRQYAGGSSANTLTTVARLMQHHVKVDFLGNIGEGSNSRVVENAMSEAGVNLIRAKVPDGLTPQLANSYVLLREDGDRSIFTHPGNIRR